ncbi:MAG: GNAT family N-acetyltransferase [Ramlibacter sp.]
MNDIEVVRLAKKDVLVARQLAAEFLAEPSVPLERLSDLLDDERTIVLAALHQGAAIGYLVAYRFPSLAGETLVYLYDIEVRPDLHRIGIGRNLVSTLQQICKTERVDSIWVGSSVTNVAACALWHRTGAEREPDHFVEFVYEL